MPSRRVSLVRDLYLFGQTWRNYMRSEAFTAARVMLIFRADDEDCFSKTLAST